MKIYNSLEKKNVELKIINNKLSIYVCGPTVYNHAHVGNIRPIVIFDVLYRLLKIFKVDVTFVHNITDIDDKIIKQASIENKTELELSNYYFQQYKTILEKLNISKGIYMPKVSEHISGIIDYINVLKNKNFAYEVNGNVYFDISKVNNYGMLSNKNINELEVGARVDENSEKISPYDFVLWKKTQEGINWKSSFSMGRPGWHTECAYLIKKYIGDFVDIHGGGVDLKFPHHENENAQNQGICNKDIARYWMHVGHVNVNDNKMAKSSNNFVYAKDLLTAYSANAIRWFFYKTSYTNPINFVDEYVLTAENEVNDIINTLNVFKSYLIINDTLRPIVLSPRIFDELLNNLNTPNLISFINAEIKAGNASLREKNFDILNLKYNIIYTLMNVLGIDIPNRHNSYNIDLLIRWDKLKSQRNFVQADVLRKELVNKKLI